MNFLNFLRKRLSPYGLASLFIYVLLLIFMPLSINRTMVGPFGFAFGFIALFASLLVIVGAGVGIYDFVRNPTQRQSMLIWLLINIVAGSWFFYHIFIVGSTGLR